MQHALVADLHQFRIDQALASVVVAPLAANFEPLRDLEPGWTLTSWDNRARLSDDHFWLRRAWP